MLPTMKRVFHFITIQTEYNERCYECEADGPDEACEKIYSQIPFGYPVSQSELEIIGEKTYRFKFNWEDVVDNEDHFICADSRDEADKLMNERCPPLHYPVWWEELEEEDAMFFYCLLASRAETCK